MGTKVLGVLSEKEASDALAKAAADKIKGMSTEEAEATLAEQAADESAPDPEKTAADNVARGRFAYFAMDDMAKFAAEQVAAREKAAKDAGETPDLAAIHAEVYELCKEAREKFAADTEEIPDDQGAIELAQAVEEMASDPAGAQEIRASYDRWSAARAGGNEEQAA